MMRFGQESFWDRKGVDGDIHNSKHEHVHHNPKQRGVRDNMRGDG